VHLSTLLLSASSTNAKYVPDLLPCVVVLYAGLAEWLQQLASTATECRVSPAQALQVLRVLTTIPPGMSVKPDIPAAVTGSLAQLMFGSSAAAAADGGSTSAGGAAAAPAVTAALPSSCQEYVTLIWMLLQQQLPLTDAILRAGLAGAASPMSGKISGPSVDAVFTIARLLLRYRRDQAEQQAAAGGDTVVGSTSFQAFASGLSEAMLE
jgi:hypothetical protein